MSNLSELKDAYLAQGVAQLTDSIELLEFKAALDSWYNARTALESLTATDVSSYSIAGRSVTRAQSSTLRADVARLEAEIRGYLRGGQGGVIDMSGAEWGKAYEGQAQ
jgi:hypothetical protein